MDRWQYVTKAKELRAALAYYAQPKAPVPDPATAKMIDKLEDDHDIKLMSFDESSRHAEKLQDYLDGRTHDYRVAYSAANALGIYLMYGILWDQMPAQQNTAPTDQ